MYSRYCLRQISFIVTLFKLRLSSVADLCSCCHYFSLTRYSPDYSVYVPSAVGWEWVSMRAGKSEKIKENKFF